MRNLGNDSANPITLDSRLGSSTPLLALAMEPVEHAGRAPGQKASRLRGGGPRACGTRRGPSVIWHFCMRVLKEGEIPSVCGPLSPVCAAK
eukprot:486818-Prymnesium_polylepis.1